MNALRFIRLLLSSWRPSSVPYVVNPKERHKC